ncbi:MAG: hypothetical protein ACOC40_02285 [Thermoplasmatota archaeon]
MANMLSNQDWLNFRGKWGEDGGSPNGPLDWFSDWYTTQAYMWAEPLYWHSVVEGEN